MLIFTIQHDNGQSTKIEAVDAKKALVKFKTQTFGKQGWIVNPGVVV